MDIATQSQERARSNAEFCHDSLDGSGTQIRLLHPLGAQHGRLHYELRIFSLYVDPPMWKALSYPADRNGPLEEIFINGKEFYVDATLFGFLKQISEEDETNWIFIDAICINQANSTERSQMVNMTGTIYRGATEVMVWIPFQTNGKRDERWLDERLERLQVLEPAGVALYVNRKETRWIRGHLYDYITNHDYWTGVHVVQQVSLAAKLTIRLASFKADDSDVMKHSFRTLPTVLPGGSNLEDIRRSYLDGFEYYMLSEADLMALTILKMRADIGSSLRNGNFIPFYVAFNVFHRMRHDGLRDLVFQLLGVMRTHVVLDYKMSQTQLLIELLADLVVSTGMHKADSIDEWVSGGPRGATIFGENFRRVVFRFVQSAFDRDLTNPLTFLILREVCIHFAPKSETLSQQEFCTHTLKMSFRFAQTTYYFRQQRGWFLTTAVKKKRLKRKILPRIQEMYLRLEEDKLQNKILTSPFKSQEDETGEARPCREWIQFVHARCDVILQRSKEGELASKATNQRLKPAG